MYKREWKVYFGGGFYDNRRKSRAGQELSIGKKFNWNGKDWYIPAIYVCAKGFVIDFCIAVQAETITAYYEKWGFAEGKPDRLNEEERNQVMRENPMDIHFDVKAEVNKKALREWHGSGMYWIPEKCFFEGMENTEEAMKIVEHYSLDKEMGWVFHRVAFPWVTKTKPTIKTLSLELKPRLISIDGLAFATPNIGESISFLHPVSGETHTLTARSFEKETLSTEHFPEKNYEFPSNFIKMSYTLSPDIPDMEFAVKDVCPNDTPRRISALDGLGAVSIGIIGGADGPTAVFLLRKTEMEKLHMACSALRFEPVEEVKWRMVFRRKPCEDITVKLLP